MKDAWVDALSRLERWDGDVAVSWAEAPDRSGAWALLGITLRGGTQVSDIDYRFEHLHVRSRMQPARTTAQMLREGRVLRAMGDREFREIQPTEGVAFWLTTGTTYGMTGPLPTPSYYFSIYIADQDLIAQAQLSSPAFGPGQPYYPTGEDALLDVLYGVTRDQGRREIFNQIVIHLPYTDAYIENAVYVDGEGMVVSIGEGMHGSSRDHRLQAIWKIQASDRTYERDARVITKPGSLTFQVDVEPHYFAASLQDPLGLLVDTIEHRQQTDPERRAAPLSPEALPEAFDFLASVWLNITHQHLFEVRRVSPAAELGAPVTTREDFSSRMSAFGDVLKAIRVDDSLVDLASAKGLAKDASLGRLKLAVQKLLTPSDVDRAIAALDVLQNLVRVRVALQHHDAKPDLPTSFARLGINHPVEWTVAWELVRQRAATALRDLRQALESVSP